MTSASVSGLTAGTAYSFYVFVRDEAQNVLMLDELQQRAIHGQSAKFYAGDGQTGDQFGMAMAMSADGNTIVVGAPINGNDDVGAAYVFVRNGASWNQAAKLTASDTIRTNHLGLSVAISSNGSVIAVGAPNNLNSTTPEPSICMSTPAPGAICTKPRN